MGEIENLLLGTTILLLLMIIFTIIVFIIVIRKEQNIKQVTIKEYIEEYLEKYKNSQLIEFDSKLKPDEAHQVMRIYLIVFSIIFPILMCCFKFIIVKSLFIGFFILGLCVLCCIMCPFLIRGTTTIEKIRLKSNVIELYNRHDEGKSYRLDEINLRYEIHDFRVRYGITKYINIYFNNDKYTSFEYKIHNFEPYIAFVILVNLLKANDIEKINNLNDEDIEKLQQKFIYSEV